VKILLSGNSIVEFRRIEINLVKVIHLDSSRAGFLGFHSKDLVTADFTPSCYLSNGLYYKMAVKQIGFCDEKVPFILKPD
jgi:hypothetical protein